MGSKCCTRAENQNNIAQRNSKRSNSEPVSNQRVSNLAERLSAQWSRNFGMSTQRQQSIFSRPNGVNAKREEREKLIKLLLGKLETLQKDLERLSEMAED